jgi:hypothetical protein
MSATDEAVEMDSSKPHSVLALLVTELKAQPFTAFWLCACLLHGATTTTMRDGRTYFFDWGLIDEVVD